MTMSERIADWLTGTLLALVLMVLYAPVFVGALFSIVPVRGGHVFWHDASFGWYAGLWSNHDILSALSTTLFVGVIAVAVSSVLASLLALYVRMPGSMLRGVIDVVVYLPFLLPPIVTGLSLLVFFAKIGMPRGLITIVIGHAIFVLSIIYRLVGVRLDAIGRSTIEASGDLGANWLQTLRYVLLPQMAPAIATGALLAFAQSFDETLITVFLAGDATTLPLRLWAMVRVGFSPEINALVTLVLLASFILAGVIAIRLRPTEKEL